MFYQQTTDHQISRETNQNVIGPAMIFVTRFLLRLWLVNQPQWLDRWGCGIVTWRSVVRIQVKQCKSSLVWWQKIFSKSSLNNCDITIVMNTNRVRTLFGLWLCIMTSKVLEWISSLYSFMRSLSIVGKKMEGLKLCVECHHRTLDIARWRRLID